MVKSLYLRVGHNLDIVQYWPLDNVYFKMNYINIKEAVKATGKSEKTIRRFLSKTESKPFTDKIDNKLVVDVNYLFSSYPPVKNVQDEPRQKLNTDQNMSMDIDHLELKSKLVLYEQEIRHKDQLLAEKDGRIMDLQKAMLLLEAPKKQEQPVQKKKRWWRF